MVVKVKPSVAQQQCLEQIPYLACTQVIATVTTISMHSRDDIDALVMLNNFKR